MDFFPGTDTARTSETVKTSDRVIVGVLERQSTVTDLGNLEKVSFVRIVGKDVGRGSIDSTGMSKGTDRGSRRRLCQVPRVGEWRQALGWTFGCSTAWVGPKTNHSTSTSTYCSFKACRSIW